MQVWRIVCAALVAVGCATAGGGGIFPETGNAEAAIRHAEQQLSQAQQAGADSLAADILAAARANLEEARTLLRNNREDRAALAAREAAADAQYARAQAQRMLAEREQAAARAALAALPPEGGAR